MVRLIVAEKPSVARDLGQVLGAKVRGAGCLMGAGLIVTWCLGHVAELCEPAEHDPAWKRWDAAVLPMLPTPFKLRPVASSRDHWRLLRGLLRQANLDEVVNACDAGREGELIFRLAYELAGCQLPVQRLWLSALTPEAVRRAYANLRPGRDYDPLADAARCRSEADWLVGLNGTRALTLRERRRGSDSLLTVGRVQTPTLAMLARREVAIRAFVPEPYWQVHARFRSPAGDHRGILHRGPVDRLPTAAEADLVVQAVIAATASVQQVHHQERSEPPPLLYDLTSLQRRANQRYGLRATDTLACAQALYERHKLLTYPRTDANHLTQDQAAQLPGILASLAREPYAEHLAPLLAAPLRLGPRIIDDAEVRDHHAIIPTGRTCAPGQLSADEAKIFDLVARRFIAAFCLPARFALTRIETVAAGHTFVSRGRSCTQIGWQAAEPPLSQGETPLLPAVMPGMSAAVTAADSRALQTKPPPRYTEAMLLGAMERAGSELTTRELRLAMKDCGLGTPATRASIIEGLQRRGFVERQGKLLLPTSAGLQVVAALPLESLKSPELTGVWEARLAQVARGSLARTDFMAEVRTFTAQVVQEILGRKESANQQRRRPAPSGAAARPEPPLPCPACAQGSLVSGRAAWGCGRWRQGCDFVIPFIVEAQPLSSTQLRQLLQHRRLSLAGGRTLVLQPGQQPACRLE